MRKILRILSIVLMISILVSLTGCDSTNSKETSKAANKNSVTSKSQAENNEFDINITQLKVDSTAYNTKFIDDYTFTVGDLSDIPKIYEGSKAYTYFVSNTISSQKYFQKLIFNIDKKNIDGSTVSLDVRVCSEDNNWTEFKKVEDMGEVNFPTRYNKFQYRFTVVVGKNSKIAPIIKVISIKGK